MGDKQRGADKGPNQFQKRTDTFLSYVPWNLMHSTEKKAKLGK